MPLKNYNSFRKLVLQMFKISHTNLFILARFGIERRLERCQGLPAVRARGSERRGHRRKYGAICRGGIRVAKHERRLWVGWYLFYFLFSSFFQLCISDSIGISDDLFITQDTPMMGRKRSWT